MREEVYLATGEKTRIRPFFRSDVDRWQEWPDHPEPLYVIHNPKRMPGSVRDSWYRDLLDRQRQQPYAVDDLAGQMIGRIFLRNQHRDEGLALLGIDFHPAFVGKGYGSDALRAFLRYYFSELGFGRILLSVASYNLRARRAYVRLGFQEIASHWDRHDPRARRLLRDPRYGDARWCFRESAGRLEARFEDMLLTRERFAEATLVDATPSL